MAKSEFEEETADELGFASDAAEGAGEGVDRWRGELPGDSNMIARENGDERKKKMQKSKELGFRKFRIWGKIGIGFWPNGTRGRSFDA